MSPQGQYDTVFLNRQSLGKVAGTDPVRLTGDWSQVYCGCRYRVLPFTQFEQAEDAAVWHFCAPEDSRFFVRNRKPGDRILLAGMDQPKKLARLMIDEKIPVPMRESWPVITTDKNELLLVPGIRPSAKVSQQRCDGDNWVLIEQFNRM